MKIVDVELFYLAMPEVCCTVIRKWSLPEKKKARKKKREKKKRAGGCSGAMLSPVFSPPSSYIYFIDFLKFFLTLFSLLNLLSHTLFSSVCQIHLVADGTQDSFLVRVVGDNGLCGWGESDASPLVSIACFVCPPSHSSIVNLRATVLGQELASVEDIRRISALIHTRAADVEHRHHAMAALDIALWDLLGM